MGDLSVWARLEQHFAAEGLEGLLDEWARLNALVDPPAELPPLDQLWKILQARTAQLPPPLAARLQGPALPFVPRTTSLLPLEPPAVTKAALEALGVNPVRAFFFGPNRNDPVLRAIRAAKALREELGYFIPIVVMTTEGDENSDYVSGADFVFKIPGGLNAFLNLDEVIRQLIEFCEFHHIPKTDVFPGWGMLSENTAFVAKLEEAGFSLIGPYAWSMALAGPKDAAKKVAVAQGLPVAKDSEVIRLLADGTPDLKHAREQASKVGFPLFIKPVHGGGGKGQERVDSMEELEAKLVSAVVMAKRAFKSGQVFFERFIEEGRHVEVQVLGKGKKLPAKLRKRILDLALSTPPKKIPDKLIADILRDHGAPLDSIHVVGVRVCSAQRRQQKMLEWGGPGIPGDEIAAKVRSYAQAFAAALGYKGPGTVEFLVDKDGNIFFMEMNTRLQVEHLVTEQAYAIDLMREAIRGQMGFATDPAFLARIAAPAQKYVINYRLLAENVPAGFVPSPGKILFLRKPELPGVRVDTGVEQGDNVSDQYDNMVAKITATADTWPGALALLKQAIIETVALGVDTNQEFTLEIMDTDEMRKNGGMGLTINFVERYAKTKNAYLQQDAEGVPEYLTEEVDRDSDFFYDLPEGIRNFYLKYGFNWSKIADPFLFKENDDLIRALVHEHTLGHTIANPTIAYLVERYAERWNEPKPYADEAIVGAALHAYHERRAEIAQDLLDPNSDDPFNPDTMPPEHGLHFQAMINGQTADIQVREFSLSRFIITVNGTPVLVDAYRKDLHTYTVQRWGSQTADRGNSFNVYVSSKAGLFNVRVGGTVYTHDIKLGAAGVKEDKGVMTSPMPGRVVRLAAGLAVGATVKKDDPLVVVEAMKMENPIKAAVSGKIIAIKVDVGAAVQQGQVLVVIEPEVTAVADADEVKPHVFMPGHAVGTRASLSTINYDRDPAEYDGIMAEAKERMHEIAVPLLTYLGQYLRGFDYNQGQLDRYLTLLEGLAPEVSDSEAFSAAYVDLLNQYADLQELFSYDARLRDEFDYFLRHWRKMGNTVSPELARILRKNLAHFGLAIPEGQALAPDEVNIKTHSFENALLRIRRAWTNGDARRGLMSRILALAGQYKLSAAKEVLRVIHARAEAGDATVIAKAVVGAARSLDTAFYHEFVHPDVPPFLKARYDALEANVFDGLGAAGILQLQLGLSQALSQFKNPDVAFADSAGKLAKLCDLAKVYGAEVAKLASPFEGYEVYLFKQRAKDAKGIAQDVYSIMVYSRHADPLNLEYDDRGRLIREAGIENRYIRATQIVRMVMAKAVMVAPQLVFNNHEIFLHIEPKVLYDRTGETTDPKSLSNDRLQILGGNIFPFAGATIARTTAFAHYDGRDGEAVQAAFQFIASRDGELVQIREREADYYRQTDPRTLAQHAKGKLTPGERAQRLFDAEPHYEALKVPGVDDTGKPNAIMLSTGHVGGIQVVSYLSDARISGGAVGAAEGQKMAAAALIAYLRGGIPVVSFNDSGGAKIPEGTPALDYSAVDFFVKAAAGRNPQDFSRLVEGHANWEFFKRIIDTYGDGRPLYEQVRDVARPPLQIALMVGANSGMVVYGPAELVHVAMRKAVEVFGVLTGQGVIYEVQNVWMRNYDIGGYDVLLRRAGTVGYGALTEDDLVQLSKIFIQLFYENYHPEHEVFYDAIQRPAEGPEQGGQSEGSVLTRAFLRAHTDSGSPLGYKDDFRNAEGLTTAYAVLGGRTVALLGPLHQHGYGSKQAVEKADRFVRGAVREGVPVLRVLGQHWIDRHQTDDGVTLRRREELLGFLNSDAAQRVPQITIIEHPDGLSSMSGNIGSHVQIYVKSSLTTERDLYQAKQKGCVIVESVKEAMDYVARFVRYTTAGGSLPQFDSRERATGDLKKLIPANKDQPYDMRAVLKNVFDEGSFFEVGQTDGSDPTGSNLITGFATLNGRVVGLFADDVQIRSGSAGWRDADKFRRFVESCTHLGIPMVYMEDCPGFQPGADQEGHDIQGRGGQLIKAIVESAVPKLKVVLRKSNGGRNIQGFHPWMTNGVYAIALEDALIGVMGARGGIPFTYKNDPAYTAIIKTAPGLIEALVNAVRTQVAGLAADHADLGNKILKALDTITAVRQGFEFKRLDNVKTFIASYESEWQKELPAQADIAGIIEQAKVLIAAVTNLVDRYNREVASPKIALKNGIIDHLADPVTLRRDMIAGLEEAERRAARRPYATLTRHEASLAHALALLHGLGFAAKALVHDAHDADFDTIQVYGFDNTIRADEVLQICKLLPAIELAEFTRDNMQEAVTKYLLASDEARLVMLDFWRVSHLPTHLLQGAGALSPTGRVAYARAMLVGALDVMRAVDPTLVDIADPHHLTLAELMARLDEAQAILERAEPGPAVTMPVSDEPIVGSEVSTFAAPFVPDPVFSQDATVSFALDFSFPGAQYFDPGAMQKEIVPALVSSVLQAFAKSRGFSAEVVQGLLDSLDLNEADRKLGLVAYRQPALIRVRAGDDGQLVITTHDAAGEKISTWQTTGFLPEGKVIDDVIKDRYARRAKYEVEKLPAEPAHDRLHLRHIVIMSIFREALVRVMREWRLPAIQFDHLLLNLKYEPEAVPPEMVDQILAKVPATVTVRPEGGALHLTLLTSDGSKVATSTTQLLANGRGAIPLGPLPEAWSGRPGIIHTGMIQAQFEAALHKVAPMLGLTPTQIQSLTRDIHIHNPLFVGEQATLAVRTGASGSIEMGLYAHIAADTGRENFDDAEDGRQVLIAAADYRQNGLRRATMGIIPALLKADQTFYANATSVVAGWENSQGLQLLLGLDEEQKRLWTRLAPSTDANRVPAMLLAGDEVASMAALKGQQEMVTMVHSTYTPLRLPEAADQIFVVAAIPDRVLNGGLLLVHVDFVDAGGQRIGRQELEFKMREHGPLSPRREKAMQVFVESVQGLEAAGEDAPSRGSLKFLRGALGEGYGFRQNAEPAESLGGAGGGDVKALVTTDHGPSTMDHGPVGVVGVDQRVPIVGMGSIAPSDMLVAGVAMFDGNAALDLGARVIAEPEVVVDSRPALHLVKDDKADAAANTDVEVDSAPFTIGVNSTIGDVNPIMGGVVARSAAQRPALRLVGR